MGYRRPNKAGTASIADLGSIDNAIYNASKQGNMGRNTYSGLIGSSSYNTVTPINPGTPYDPARNPNIYNNQLLRNTFNSDAKPSIASNSYGNQTIPYDQNQRNSANRLG